MELNNLTEVTLSLPNNFLDCLKDFVTNTIQTELKKLFCHPKEKDDEWLTIKETKEYIKVSSPTLWEMTRKGTLRKHYIDGKPRYKKSEIDAAFLSVTFNNKKIEERIIS